MTNFLVLGLFFLAQAVLAGRPQATVEQEIMKLAEEFSDAEAKADIPRMSQLLADDFTGIEDDGSVSTKTSVLKLFQSPTTKLKSDKLSEMRVRVYGKTAVVNVLDTADFTVNGKNAGGVFRLTNV